MAVKRIAPSVSKEGEHDKEYGLQVAAWAIVSVVQIFCYKT
jgi:hypothetical protein